MKKSSIIIFLFLVIQNTQAQDYLISFAGSGDTTIVSTVHVDNLTSGASVTLTGGDVLHLLGPVGIGSRHRDIGNIQIYPNPISDESMLTFLATGNGNALICLVDLSGKTVYQTSTFLPTGTHSFRISGISRGMYFVNVTAEDYFYSTKLISQCRQASEAVIAYISSAKNETGNQIKIAELTIDMPYTNGDQLLFKGVSGRYSTIVTDIPTGSKPITFNFSACTDAENNNYATVQIGAQVWMAENLNIGVPIDDIQMQTNNGVIEKYCYDNNINNCDTYGGLYQWNEMMQYITTPAAQGICPSGWHIPTDEEWTMLAIYLHGEDVAGGKMKSPGNLDAGTGLWLTPNTGATNESGFSAVPGGCRNFNGGFGLIGGLGYWWSSTRIASVAGLRRAIYNDSILINRWILLLSSGVSVRCLKGSNGQGSHNYLINFECAGDTTMVSTITVDNITSGTSVTLTGEDNLLLVVLVDSCLRNFSDSNMLLFPNQKVAKSEIIEMPYTHGNQLLFRGVSGQYGNIIADVPYSSKTLTFNFAACTDAANNNYSTVNIGTQTWMAENLKVGVQIDGVLEQSNNGIVEKYCYNNDASNCDIYGGLYQWNEVMQYDTTPGGSGICPIGWHIPSDDEWEALSTYLQGEDLAGGKMKTTGTIEDGTGLWYSPNAEATNSTGFSGVPGGFRYYSGDFGYIGLLGSWWGSTELDTYTAHSPGAINSDRKLHNYITSKGDGIATRCLRDL